MAAAYNRFDVRRGRSKIEIDDRQFDANGNMAAYQGNLSLLGVQDGQ